MSTFLGNATLQSFDLPDPYEDDCLSPEAQFRSAEIVDFRLNVNPLGPPPASRRAVVETLSETYRYPPPSLPELRAAVATWHDVAPESLLFGSGLDEIIKLLVHGWTNTGDRVVVHVPTFPRYELEVRARGAVALRIEGETPWAIPLRALSHALASRRIALAFICCPNNPTLGVVRCGELEEMISSFPLTQFVIDEALIYPPAAGAVPLVSRHPNVAVLRTFSKYFGLAGLRVGYMIGDSRRLRLVEVIRPPFNVCGVSAAAATAALGGLSFLERSRKYFAQEVKKARTVLEGELGWTVHGGDSNLLMVDLGRGSADALIGRLAREGLLVVNCNRYVGLEEANAIRVSLRRRHENLKLLTALRQIWDGGQLGDRGESRRS